MAVAPLAVPDPAAQAADVAVSPAVELLLERAAAAGADLAVTESSAPGASPASSSASTACRWRSSWPRRSCGRCRRTSWSTGSVASWSPSRRRSRGVIDQLPSDTQRLYRRLAVFGGTFGMDDLETYAERSVAHGLEPARPGLAEDLDRLVAAGLVRRRMSSDADATVRYELPSLIRDDAERRLAETGAATAAHWAHAMCLLELAEDVDRRLQVRSNLEALQRLDAAP